MESFGYAIRPTPATLAISNVPVPVTAPTAVTVSRYRLPDALRRQSPLLCTRPVTVAGPCVTAAGNESVNSANLEKLSRRRSIRATCRVPPASYAAAISVTIGSCRPEVSPVTAA